MLIVGLGNIIMGDDGVGVRAVRELEKFKIKGVELLEGATSGISLLPHLRGKRRVIIIDAVQGGGEEPGTIYRLSEKELQKPEFRFFSLHDISLEHVLALGRELFSDEFPEEIVIYGVEVKEIKLSEELSEPVKKALPRLVELLRREMENHVFSGAGSD